jgi:hypothetical protein
MSDQPPVSLLSHFAALNDPRQAAKISYPLPEIPLLLLCATIAGADDFVEVTLWGEQHVTFLRRFQPFRQGIPSHDVLCDVIATIDPEAFKTCFHAWVETLQAKDPAIIAVDGKTSRRSHGRGRGRMPRHTVSAWATGQQLVLGQEATEVKSNEITAIPLLLQHLDLHGALVTVDAMGTQTAIAQTILDGGGDYVLALKKNGPATYAEVAQAFADPVAGLTIQRSGDVEKLTPWLHNADRLALYGIRRFVHTLRQDLVAVRNAITETWSNGQTEGQINRLKMLKRAMYGRAGIDLLRARMIPLGPFQNHTK